MDEYVTQKQTKAVSRGDSGHPPPRPRLRQGSMHKPLPQDEQVQGRVQGQPSVSVTYGPCCLQSACLLLGFAVSMGTLGSVQYFLTPPSGRFHTHTKPQRTVVGNSTHHPLPSATVYSWPTAVFHMHPVPALRILK